MLMIDVCPLQTHPIREDIEPTRGLPALDLATEPPLWYRMAKDVNAFVNGSNRLFRWKRRRHEAFDASSMKASHEGGNVGFGTP
jgi:hypothetical protein